VLYSYTYTAATLQVATYVAMRALASPTNWFYTEDGKYPLAGG